MPQNLSRNIVIALQNLSKIKNLIVQKSDKRNSVITADRHDYIKKMDNKENILSDLNKFSSHTLKHVNDMIRTCSQMHHTVKYSQHGSIIWPV